MSKRLRKGMAKHLLENSISSVITAVEIYNKPNTQFKIQTFIALMIIGWTKVFHAYFHREGIKYYHKKNGKYIKIDGDFKTWEITECIREFTTLNHPVKANLEFFIRLRNKIEHRDLSDSDIEMITIGECQSFLYNYETFIIENFGSDYAINESLRFALQFSTLRTQEQLHAKKRQLLQEVQEIKDFIDKYRTSLHQDVFDSQEYSVKFLIVPKISNTNRGDLAIEFVKAESLSSEDYEKITAIVKDKKIVKEAVNVKRHKPAQVVKLIRRIFKLSESTKFSTYHHTQLCKAFVVRPYNGEDPFDTKTEYCLYDEAHNDYVYTSEWIKFLSSQLKPNFLEQYQTITTTSDSE